MQEIGGNTNEITQGVLRVNEIMRKKLAQHEQTKFVEKKKIVGRNMKQY